MVLSVLRLRFGSKALILELKSSVNWNISFESDAGRGTLARTSSAEGQGRYLSRSSNSANFVLSSSLTSLNLRELLLRRGGGDAPLVPGCKDAPSTG